GPVSRIQVFLTGFKRLPKNSELIRIGSFSIRVKKLFQKDIYVSLKFSGHPESFVSINLLPMLVEGSFYNDARRIGTHFNNNKEFYISDNIENIVYADRKWLKVINGDETIIISKMELARVLYFHNKHLVRAAFRPNGLLSIARIEETDETTIINVDWVAKYPVSQLESKNKRAHFSWLLLDEDVKRSFGSIYEAWISKNTLQWMFDFSPPNMKNWKLKVLGEIEHVPNLGQVFVVREAVGVQNPKKFHDKEIKVFHPDFKNKSSKGLHDNFLRQFSERMDNNPEMALNIPPSKTKRAYTINDNTFSFSLNPGVSISKSTDKTSKKPSAKPAEDAEVINDKVSAGNSLDHGDARELENNTNVNDFQGKPEPDEKSKLVEIKPTEKFFIFEEVIKDLKKKYSYTVETMKCYNLNNSSNNEKKLDTINDEPIRCHIAVVKYKGIYFTIVDVDTEIIIKKHFLSNLLISFSGDSDASLTDILEGCFKNGVKWDKAIIKQHAATFRLNRHPNKYYGGDPVPAKVYHASWVASLDRRIQDMMPQLQTYEDQVQQGEQTEL
ncbi:Tn7-like element transposition protein TnsE, partial [Halomonas sp. MES3-P3E]|uniref:Tn7-like element transposition protein TnsE n=1 Tax=Halomonas sp. MES3-P3E TaxID=2058321 RepID=UPI000CCA2783